MKILFRVSLIGFCALIAALWILEGMQLARAGDSTRLTEWVRNIFGCVVIIMATFGFALWRLSEGETRARVLRSQLPGSTVVPARGSPAVRRAFANMALTGAAPTSSFALTTSSDGLTCWSGRSDPEEFITISWPDVREIATSTIQLGVLGNFPALRMIVRGGGDPLIFRVSRSGFFGLGTLGGAKLAALVEELVAKKAEGMGSPEAAGGLPQTSD